MLGSLVISENLYSKSVENFLREINLYHLVCESDSASVLQQPIQLQSTSKDSFDRRITHLLQHPNDRSNSFDMGAATRAISQIMDICPRLALLLH